MPDLRRRSVVLCVAALLLTAPVLPAIGAGPETSDRSTADTLEATTIVPDSIPASNATSSNRSAVERKRAAIARIESMDPGWRFQRRQRDRAANRLNGTLATYRDGYRVSTPSAFRDDRRALRSLATIAWTDAAAAEEAAALVVSADLATVNASVDDARFALQRTRGRIEDPRERRRAERAIERAVRSREEALDALDDRGWSGWFTTNRQRALRHLGAAWLHAQYALEVLDRASTPSVAIETRSDPPRNASDPTALTVRGNVSDVRAYEIENVSVAVNGGPVGVAPIDASPTPGRNASFAVNVTLDGPVVEVALTVTDVDRGHRGRGHERTDDRWRRFDWHRHRDDGDAGDDGDDEQSDTDVVRFDGDGLPDTYERTVVGTDALDPDSDSRLTDGNESGDGVLDGGEDFDGDRLVTYAEFDRGTDPFANDTDGDGLPDRFEASIPSLFDPTDADTDGDGVADGSEDTDGDGLSAVAEYGNDTSVARPDSDRDGLDDAAEVRSHGTSPLDVDTDGDGLDDAEELRLDADPLLADTDGDGVPDGNETYTTTKVDEETGVRLSLSGPGDVARDVTLETVSQPSGSDHLAAPVVRIRNHTGFENATVTLPLDGDAASTMTDLDNFSVYKWSPADGRPWHPLNSTVDPANGTVSAAVASFSFFTVMDEGAWEAAITDTVPITWPGHESFDDLSGWDVEGDASVENGNLVVSASRKPAVDPDYVVAEDGSGDFERIQPAVDAASPGDTVLVETGTYRETVALDESIRLVGRDATIASGPESGRAGIDVGSEISPSISGFTIEGFEHGIEGRSAASDVQVADVTLRGNRIGLELRRSSRWTLKRVIAAENHEQGLKTYRFEGPLRLIGTNVTKNGNGGIHAWNSEAELTLTDTGVSRNGGIGLLFAHSTCECDIVGGEISENGGHGVLIKDNPFELRMADVEVRRNDAGLYLDGEQDVTLSDVDVVGNEYGIYADGTSGRFQLSNVEIDGEWKDSSSGIKAISSSADWALDDVEVSRNERTGVYGRKTTGTWSLRDVELVENGVNLEASEASGSWSLVDARIERAETDGISAADTTGNWSLEDGTLSNNGRDGLVLARTSGSWQIERVAFDSNGRYGMEASDVAGNVDVSHSAIEGNGLAGIEATSAVPPVDASENWWGQATGPTSVQATGNVLTDPSCQNASCSADATLRARGSAIRGRPIAEPRLAGTSRLAEIEGAGGSSSIRRTLNLPADAERITMRVRAKGRAEGESTAEVLVTGGTETAVVLDGAGTSGRFVTGSADVSRFAGETVTVEVLAEGDAEIAVDWIDVAYDSDGDGLRDAVERAGLGMPAGPMPGATLADLDPTNPDSDGDGLLDGEELTEVTVDLPSDRLAGRLSIRAERAVADPTLKNSDGGGLPDGEEVDVGSDPFVLETLVIGYTIPTMTHGPGDTLEDRQPMTVGEVNGYQAGGGPDSDLIAWPSRQYYDPFFCIKELRPGPGCSEAWMQGVTLRDDHFYLYVPFVVYAQSDLDFGGVPYDLSLEPHWTANIVKRVNTSGTLARGQSQRGYIVYEFPEEGADFELQRGIFRPLGRLSLRADLSKTVFERPEPSSVGRRYTVSTSTTLPRTEAMLQDTQTILEQGINIAFAVEAGYAVAIETGSSLRGALVFLYHLAQSQTSTPPTSVEDVAEKVSQKGIAAFEEKVQDTQGEIDEDVFGDGVVRTGGPTLIRQN